MFARGMAVTLNWSISVTFCHKFSNVELNPVNPNSKNPKSLDRVSLKNFHAKITITTNLGKSSLF